MQINYRVLGLALLLSVSRVGLGQTATTREDSVKGQIWTATARRVWADEKVTSPAAKWATGADFNKWVLTQKPDRTELGSLFSAVLTRVGKGQPATPTQVVQAILSEVSQRKTHKTGALAKVNLQSLQVDLSPFVPATSTTSALVAAADSASPAAAQPAGAAHTVAENQSPAPEVQTPTTAPTYSTQPLEPRYFGLPPALAGVALALLGALIGAGIASARQRTTRPRHRHHAHATPAEPDSTSIMNSPEYRKLQKQNQTLNTQLHRIQQQLTDLQARVPGATLLTPPPAVEISSAAEEAPAEDLVGAAPALPSATRYGPVQETPFVEERKIVDSPLPQLALMLTVNPRNPDQATFTLNPQVDQARLIGDGLTRLQKFFDYDPPLGGRISSVAAIKPGRLQRHDSGWQVIERARLAIS